MAETKRKTPAIFDRALGEWQPPPQYIPFPEFQEPPALANPVIAYRYGQDVLARPEAFVSPRLYFYPYFEQPAPAAANPVIPFLVRRLEELTAEQAEVRARFYPLMAFVEPPPPSDAKRKRYSHWYRSSS